jgi:hypothetical protein
MRANEEQTALQGRVHWTDVLISKLSATVKLVGPTINCGGSPLHGDVNGVWRDNPHVQSYVVATDQVGLSILLKDEEVFQCHDNMWDTIYHSELGSSSAVLNAGYNIDSLMVRFPCYSCLEACPKVPSRFKAVPTSGAITRTSMFGCDVGINTRCHQVSGM